MEEYITKEVHEEFNQRMKEENDRQNARLNDLERKTDEIYALTVSVEKLAQSVKSMAETQEKQNGRLETLEKRDGEMWRKVVGYVVTAVVGAVVGFVFTQIGMG